MAGPQFFTPQRSAPSRPSRRFSLQEANRSLALVKRIVADIVTTHQQAATCQAATEKARGRDQSKAQAELDRTCDRLQDLVDELNDVGVELKDYQTGLVDFVGRHEGRDVYLCWKLGEERITHWHELNTGFAGRRPVSELHEQEKTEKLEKPEKPEKQTS
jgi:hypothetical protein